jgi:hypothetical protein
LADSSAIEWTEATWNPVTGCEEVSPGCAHCYAETFAERWRGIPGHPYEQGFALKLWPQRLEQPLKWSRPRMIFVSSMSDLFHEDIPASYIEQVLLYRSGRELVASSSMSWMRRMVLWAELARVGATRRVSSTMHMRSRSHRSFRGSAGIYTASRQSGSQRTAHRAVGSRCHLQRPGALRATGRVAAPRPGLRAEPRGLPAGRGTPSNTTTTMQLSDLSSWAELVYRACLDPGREEASQAADPGVARAGQSAGRIDALVSAVRERLQPVLGRICWAGSVAACRVESRHGLVA